AGRDAEWSLPRGAGKQGRGVGASGGTEGQEFCPAIAGRPGGSGVDSPRSDSRKDYQEAMKRLSVIGCQLSAALFPAYVFADNRQPTTDNRFSEKTNGTYRWSRFAAEEEGRSRTHIHLRYRAHPFEVVIAPGGDRF